MQLRERLAYAGIATGTQAPRPKELAPPPGFTRGENGFGAVYFRDQHLPIDHRHGRVRLATAMKPDDDLLARLGDGLEAEHVRRAAFLDIETTGLSGGTGTYAFLVGIGSFEGFSFRVRQFFLADPSGEPAMLTAVSETVERCQAIVTFNGKSFDLPQLATRLALSRLANKLGLPHIDLLHPARRLFGTRLESCRLGEIEREILGLRRYEDIPSWMIPELYFAYIRRRETSGLNPVFEHNLLDVVSLAALIGHLSAIAGSRPRQETEHLLALGRWDEARGRVEEAEALFEAAWRLQPESTEAGEAARRLARLLRRRGDFDGCRSVWLTEQSHGASARRLLRAKVELAKLAEHRFRDPVGALLLATEAGSILASRPDLERMLPNTSAALQHRRRRLERRIARRVSKGVTSR